ncbi:MAG: hypothetical protein ACFCVE_09735 [Phycisphaerae bacterium]
MQKLEHCTNTNQQATPDDREDQLLELDKQVKALAARLSEDKRPQVAEDHEQLVQQAIRPEPRRKWYEVSAEGLVQALMFVKDLCGNTVGTVTNRRAKLFGADISLTRSSS